MAETNPVFELFLSNLQAPGGIDVLECTNIEDSFLEWAQNFLIRFQEDVGPVSREGSESIDSIATTYSRFLKLKDRCSSLGTN